MRRGHFEALQPICPRCRLEHGREAPVELARVEQEQGETVLEGALHCSDQSCQLEYPIIDGIPLLLPDVRRYISDNLFHLHARDDLAAATESLLGDGAGPGSAFDATRQHLSTYAWDHYGDLDPSETSGTDDLHSPRPGATVRCLEQGLALLPASPDGPILDLGCSVGRTAFTLASRTDDLVLGIDVNHSMLRLAQRVLTDGVVRYPRRRVGIVFDRRELEAQLEGADRVDFWACDALALPFGAGVFGLAVAMNVIDNVSSPLDLLATVVHAVRPGGSAVIATPYDWTTAATPAQAWIGGHSQRGPDGGASEPLLRTLLTPGAHPQSPAGLRLVGELDDVAWHARLHDRSVVHYRSHLLAVDRVTEV